MDEKKYAQQSLIWRIFSGRRKNCMQLHCYITIPLLRVKRLQTQANFTRLRFQLLKVMQMNCSIL